MRQEEVTILLVGKIGSGKSATGNSILGQNAFKSASKIRAVTKTCQLGDVNLADGRLLRVIDTPGFFNPSIKIEEIQKEVANCIQLAKYGIQAVFAVVSLGTRCSSDDLKLFCMLESVFGEEILNFTSLLFTGGDQCADSDLDTDSPAQDALKGMVTKCHGRKIVFDNVSQCEQKQCEQKSQFLNMVESIRQSNGGISYSFDRIKKAMESCKEMGLSQQVGNETMIQNDMDNRSGLRKETSDTHVLRQTLDRSMDFLLAEARKSNYRKEKELEELEKRVKRAEGWKLCSIL